MLPTTDASIEQELSAVQAVFEEERDQSQLKLVLCGSMVAQMEALMGVRSPMHGRLVPLQLQPMRFRDASLFFPRQAPLAQFERFALAGGVPRYLSALSDPRGSLRSVVCDQILDRNAPLWDEGRTVLEQELREPKVYFSILQSLSSGDKELNEIVQALRSLPSSVSKYLNILEEMRIAPALNDHVALEFEDWCRDWTRSTYGREATKVGAWWGQARHDLRRAGVRSSEEIDIVGLGRGRVSVVGEAKWQRRRLDVGVLRDLEKFKIPAIEQAGFKLSPRVRILLFAKAGYTDGLVDAARRDDRIVLVDVPAALGGAASPSAE